jgi:PTH2 family peptidyl-tRNA hydrolase
MYKQVILVRQDLGLSKGKMSSQVAHASVEAVLKSKKDVVEEWRRQGMKKVVLKVKDLAELEHYKKLAGQKKLVCAVVRDAGRTEVRPGTVTCLAVGPDLDEAIDGVTGSLKMA